MACTAHCHDNKRQNMTNYDDIRQYMTVHDKWQYVTRFDNKRQDLTINDNIIYDIILQDLTIQYENILQDLTIYDNIQKYMTV